MQDIYYKKWILGKNFLFFSFKKASGRRPFFVEVWMVFLNSFDINNSKSTKNKTRFTTKLAYISELCATLAYDTKTKMIDFLDILLIIIVAISTGFFSGLIYIVYLPFKRRLLKSGKLSNERNRQINRSFIISICLLFCSILVIGYFFKDYGKTPSKNRLEKISDIHLPLDFKVLKDEYQDMTQDYCILYDIQLDKNATTELIKNIKISKFYNKNSFHKGSWTENDCISVDSAKGVWSKSPTGFDFSGQEGLTSYYVELDTMTNILKYNEFAD